MRKSIQKYFVLLLSLFLIVGMVPTSALAANTPGVSYQTHIENIGWEADAGIGWRSNGEVSGTQARSLRLEGIKINLDTQGYDLGVSYQTHIENIGWETDAGIGWQSNGNMSGTYGRSLRLEAIQIKLTGADADKFDIYYQVHAQNIGWMGWAKNGESAGTAGFSYRLEGIRIQIVPKGQAAPGTTENAFVHKLTNAEFVSKLYGYWYSEYNKQGFLSFSNTEFRFGKWGSTSYGGEYEIVDTTSNGGTIYVANVTGEGNHGPENFKFDFGTQGDDKVSFMSDKGNSFKYTAAENIGNGQYRMPSFFNTYTSGNILILNN